LGGVSALIRMRAHFVVLRTQGMTAAPTPEAFYGFRAANVIELHFRKRGAGRGLWYRLKDGRVIDAFGKRALRSRSAYSLA
ncbi:MAG: hypothetical protein JWO19_1630, partial [Bryobacterales bacterium]|nr:hypothetical protein [Bryobacterales bacterium]